MIRRLFLSALFLGVTAVAHAQLETITYQGRLDIAGSPANGNYDFRFKLFDDAAIGAPDTQIGTTNVQTLSVINGQFTTTLNFSVANPFASDNRWLQIEVKPFAAPIYTVLSARQRLTPAPSATHANTAASLILPSFSSGLPSSPSGSAFEITNTSASGGAIGGYGPTWGVVGFGGDIPTYPGIAGPLGLYGIGQNTGVGGASNTGNGVVGKTISGIGGFFTTISTGRALVAQVDGSSAGSAAEFTNTHTLNANPTVRITNAAVNFGSEALAVTNSSSSSNAYVIRAEQLSTTGTAIYATTAGTGSAISGVSSGGTAIFANGGGPNGTGLHAMGWNNGYAVRAEGRNNAIGVFATSVTTAGRFVTTNNGNTSPTLVAENDSTSANALAIQGIISSTAPGIFSAGVRGENRGTGGAGVGVYGSHAGSGYGVYGTAPAAGYAGYFAGRVHVTGTLTKGSGTFKIDHPLDPENKYLSHSFVESPDMMNVYNGNIRTDDTGVAVVDLPDYFEALNRDFRYQLTVIDESENEFVIAKIMRPVANNRFVIKTSLPGTMVSWQVTGIRQDAFAKANPVIPVTRKPDDERGRYLHPEAFGLPASRGLVQPEFSPTPDPR